MLGRYRIVRGKRPDGDPLPDGVRQDTRKHTRHVLRPEAKLVFRYLDDLTDEGWLAFSDRYLASLEERFTSDRAAFDGLADLARTGDVWIGCNCPTSRNPDVRKCHTYLALQFMAKRYPDVEVVLPQH